MDDRHREAEELSNAMTLGGARWDGWLESAALGACDEGGSTGTDFHDRIGRYEESRAASVTAECCTTVISALNRDDSIKTNIGQTRDFCGTNG